MNGSEREFKISSSPNNIPSSSLVGIFQGITEVDATRQMALTRLLQHIENGMSSRTLFILLKIDIARY